MRSVVDMFALKAGVDNRGNQATTPQQNPKHADSCAPNSHAARREAWGDAHFVVVRRLPPCGVAPRPRAATPPLIPFWALPCFSFSVYRAPGPHEAAYLPL
eukprot:5476527-Prymnesium_polylepis.3